MSRPRRPVLHANGAIETLYLRGLQAIISSINNASPHWFALLPPCRGGARSEGGSWDRGQLLTTFMLEFLALQPEYPGYVRTVVSPVVEQSAKAVRNSTEHGH